ncbi:pantetheine-phosphate adenylyltransferase [Azospirillum sp. SYSU D00513]|uniref:pantetheine-phosphate adenylyltransferase n=1 Tax=Azospirillum sp. SYSU D00513 TaxID=2812561 RepID=UPI001A96A911|nr:pantetheine-phosphate adenylyltransferase [Azospirillum sp. SYSU D00513]
MPQGRVGVYAGTFDPVTNGHLDIIVRSARLVDRLVVAVHRNSGKGPLFSLDERVAMVRREVAAIEDLAGRVEVSPFEGLLVEFARERGAAVILRGMRAISDFDYEFQMTGMNASLDRSIETLFLMASEGNQFIASRLVKEVAAMGGDVRNFVPPSVVRQLAARFPAALPIPAEGVSAPIPDRSRVETLPG